MAKCSEVVTSTTNIEDRLEHVGDAPAAAQQHEHGQLSPGELWLEEPRSRDPKAPL